jgi:hypothetical protein
MAELNAPPSGNIANLHDLTSTLRLVLNKFLQDVDDMLPAKVIAYDRTSNRAQVQPLITMVTTDNRRISRAPIASVPVFQMGGGGFVASFPIAPGDIGWIKASDRDISLFKASLKEAPPNTQRKHSFSDALFIPDTMFSGVTIAGEDVNNLVIQNKAGTVKVAWWSTFLKIIAPRVGIGGTPNANAILDIQSTTKAFVIPRMTTAQRDAIPSPQEGFLIWNTDTHGINGYNSATSTWG